MTTLPNILATRLNFDVVAFKGCTRRELMSVALISLALSLCVAIAIMMLWFGSIMAGVGVAFPMSIGVGWIGIGILGKCKQGKPKGYIKQQCQRWLDDKGIRRSPFIRYSGKWLVRRSW